ncbi:(2Fe-2S)-binding protein [Halomonadaceae bacterium KBTZ08]
MATLTINGQKHELSIPDNMPLLWALRDIVQLTGTKFGCGMALCGACTVHLDGEAIRSCTTTLGHADGGNVTTIEAMSEDAVGHKVQTAWLELGVAQCGYCQAGQIMSATALLKQNSNPSEAEIQDAMNGNICRCGTYNRIRSAIHNAAESVQEEA